MKILSHDAKTDKFEEKSPKMFMITMLQFFQLFQEAYEEIRMESEGDDYQPVFCTGRTCGIGLGYEEEIKYKPMNK